MNRLVVLALYMLILAVLMLNGQVAAQEGPGTVILHPAGQDVELLCGVAIPGTMQVGITWIINFNQYGVSSLANGILDGYSADISSSNLIVKNIVMNDNRNNTEYRCVIIMSDVIVNDSDPIFLYVAGVPTMVPGLTVDGNTININGNIVTLTLSWGEPFNNLDPIVGYTVSCSGDDTFPPNFTTTDNTTRSHTITNLTLMTNYTFSVVATNSIGSGEAGVVMITTPGVPAMVPGVTVDNNTINVNGNNVTLTLSWEEPFNNLDPIVNYTVSCSGDDTCPPNFTTTDNTTRSYTITNLTPMTNYTFSVVATNSIGSGEAGVVMITTPSDETCHPDTATCVTEFYPFGFSEGDFILRPSVDITSPAIVLSEEFMFYDQTVKTVYVGDNGIISLHNSYNPWTPRLLPLSRISFIAPYWADFDLRGTGEVYYRQTKDPILLARATNEIQTAFSLPHHVVATNLVIATWDAVGYFSRHTDKVNTFQCVLVTTVTDSFVILLYADGEIQWTTGDASGGVDGLGGTEAVVGINVGDGINSITIPGSMTPSIINIAQTSNVGIPGMWIFQVGSGFTTSVSITSAPIPTVSVPNIASMITTPTPLPTVSVPTIVSMITTPTPVPTVIVPTIATMITPTTTGYITTIMSTPTIICITITTSSMITPVSIVGTTLNIVTPISVMSTICSMFPITSPIPTVIPPLPSVIPDVTVDNNTINIIGNNVTLTLSWGKPFNNLDPIVNYTVSCSGDDTCPPNFTTIDNTTRSYTITNLTPMTNYTFSVVATNSIGSGEAGVVMITTPSALPSITTQPIPEAFKLGDVNVTAMSCSAVGMGPMYFQWEKYDSLNNSWISTSHRSLNIMSSDLKFSVITEDDEGVYRCIVTNNDGSVTSDNATIHVYGPPVIKFISNHTVKQEGQKVNLICSAVNDFDAIHPLQINWYKGNKLVIPIERQVVLYKVADNVSRQQNLTLTIDQVNHTDDGEYTCRAFNHNNSFSESKTNLTVQSPPIISIANKSPCKTSVGRFTVLHCTATGKPIPIVEWYIKDNIINNPFPTIPHPSHGSRLLLVPTHKPHKTIYTCKGINYIGNKKYTSSASITVIVEEN